MRPRAINVSVKENYILEVTFDNDETKFFDVKPYLTHKAFSELKNKEKFAKVKIDGLSISWENGADICPDELYNNSVHKI